MLLSHPSFTRILYRIFLKFIKSMTIFFSFLSIYIHETIHPPRLGGSSQKKLDYITLQFLLKCVHKCIFKDGKIEAKKSASNFFDH